MENLEKQVKEYLSNNNPDEVNVSYFYKGILWDVFCEYEHRKNNFELYKYNMPNKLLTFNDLLEIATDIVESDGLREYLDIRMNDCFYALKLEEEQEEE